MLTTAHEIVERGSWSAVIELDAMWYAESMYTKFAYKTAYKTAFYEGTVSAASANRVISGTDIKEVIVSTETRSFVISQSLLRKSGSSLLSLETLVIA